MMVTISSILTILVALLHIWFLILEMFLWTKPIGLKTFRQSLEKAQESKVLAANQGLYNGFLAAGLIWSLTSANFPAQIFFLICVVIAGAFGAYSVNKRIFFIQSMPAILALVSSLVLGF